MFEPDTPSALLEKAVATCAAVMFVEAVSVKPPTVTDRPAAISLKVRSLNSVLLVEVIDKSFTGPKELEMNVTIFPEAEPLDQPDKVPL